MARNKDKQSLPEKDTLDVLLRGKTGVLALIGKDGYPYTITVGYVCSNGKIYFRGVTAAQKIEALKHNEKASFCVVNRSKVDKETGSVTFTTALAFGSLRVVTSENQKQLIIEKLDYKYNPKAKEEAPAKKEDGDAVKPDDVTIIMFTIEHLKGKQSTGTIGIKTRKAGAPAPRKPAIPKKKAAKEDDEKVPARE